ncbi:MAG: hypothetical protein G01um101419_132 [Parcubacteria group bacterium Gr01-1014_19]|nr:MAG: hypothetical protein G01um101419_132 [Parcubacteria group bacterium Gr01-1014_19]
MENGILYRCPICDTPMFEKVGLKLFVQRIQNGKTIKMEIDRKDSEGVMRIGCGSCGKGGHILAAIHEMIGIDEVVSVKKESVVEK